MRYREFQPHRALTDHISCYWVIQGDALKESQPFITMGGLEFVINLADPQTIIDLNGCRSTFRDGIVIGPLAKANRIESQGRIHWLGVSFKPGSALVSLLKFPVRDLTDRIIRFDDLWGNGGQIIVNQCLNVRHEIDKQISLLDYYFSNKLINHSGDAIVIYALDAIIKHHGQIKIEHLARQTGLSRCQFNRRFNNRVGLTPKQFCKLERIRYTLYRFFNAPSNNLASLALECGYYDQAHFNREFNSFTGLSPSLSRHTISDLGQLLLAPKAPPDPAPEVLGEPKKIFYFAS